jgi:hypothetical protein
MKLTISTITVSTIAVVAIAAHAGLPNAHTWPMEHIMISMDDNNALHAHIATSAANPIELLRFQGEFYDNNASALENTFYSDQYGWVLDGIVDPGLGNSIWIEMTSQSDGLEAYEGGRRMMIGDQTFNPIFGTSSSDNTWQWSGMMTHNWYAALALGDYQSSYSIYVGDSAGNAIDGYGAASVTLNFRAVPSPAPVALLGMGALGFSRRKRG